MNNPQLSRKDELQKEIGKLELEFKRVPNPKENNMWQKHFHNKWTILTARLDERIRAEQEEIEFLKVIFNADMILHPTNLAGYINRRLQELKSTIQKEKTE
jgi:hypothetical protein